MTRERGRRPRRVLPYLPGLVLRLSGVVDLVLVLMLCQTTRSDPAGGLCRRTTSAGCAWLSGWMYVGEGVVAMLVDSFYSAWRELGAAASDELRLLLRTADVLG